MPPFNQDGQKSGTMRQNLPVYRCLQMFFFRILSFRTDFCWGRPRDSPEWVVCMPALTLLSQSISSNLPLGPTGLPEPED